MPQRMTIVSFFRNCKNKTQHFFAEQVLIRIFAADNMKKTLITLLIILTGCLSTGAMKKTATRVQAAAADGNAKAASCPMLKIKAERLPDLNIPRSGHALFCTEGEIVAAGGHTSGFVPTATAEYYRDGKWHLMQMAYEHDNGFFALLQSGKVLLGGGHEKHLGIGQTFVVESYDPATHSFNGFGCLDTKRSLASALELDSGQVVISGNWYADDAIELFDGKKMFTHVRDVSRNRAAPFILQTGKDDAIIFGAMDTKGTQYGDMVVDRLRGDSLVVPLFRTWRPIPTISSFSTYVSFIGNKQQGRYAYLLPVFDPQRQMAIALVEGTHFSLLPTATPVPMKGPWGNIEYYSLVVVDRQQQRGYVLGTDREGRIYLLAVDYGTAIGTDGSAKSPAQLTLLYTDPLPKECLSMPVLTEDGQLAIVGGSTSDNFAPFSAAYLLHVDGSKASVVGSCNNWIAWLLTAVGLVALGLVIFSRRKTVHVADDSLSAQTNTEPMASSDNEQLLQRIRQLMSEEKLYLSSDFKLTDLATRLNTNSRYVSDCIKATEGCSFSQFVNGYRVEHAKQLLRNRPDKKVTMVFLESGFANESSFFRTFKSVTGMTPGEWVAQELE